MKATILRSPWDLLSRGEPGGSSGISIYYRTFTCPLLVEKAPDVWEEGTNC